MPGTDTWSFASRDELIAYLRARDWKRDFREVHESIQDCGPLTAIYHSVGKSTFRAFRKGNNWTPSLVFRSWAGTELVQGGLSELQDVNSPDRYRDWALRLARSLGKEWQKRLGYKVEIPRGMKLINLLAKGLCIVSPLWPERYESIVWNIDVPLDKYSLRPLACVPELQAFGLNWPGATMGSIKDLKAYARIQDAIRGLCGKAGVPPLAYDFLAWDVPHAQ
jgi:hypothetical protein